MLKLLDKEKTHVIVKMDIYMYEQLEAWYFNDVIKDAEKSKWYNTHEEMMEELLV